MNRRPLYGGERGIRSREQSSIDTLRVFAKSDFKHDFGEGTPARDKYVDADIDSFKQIAQRYGIGKVSAMIAGFGSVLGNNPYNLLKSTIAPQIFPSTGDDNDYLDEDKALLKIGFDATKIKRLFKAEIAKQTATTFASAVLRIPDIPLNTPGGMRTYEVSGVLMKDKGGEGTLNVASRLENVTGGKTKFALLIDASTLATTSFINSDLSPLPNKQCEFHIIENIENESDSATKLTAGGLDKPKIAANFAKKPNMFFMKDIQNTVLYPEFKVGIAEKDGEALFGNANLVLSRSGDDTEADFTFADKSEYHVDRISVNANVKKASLNVLASALSKGGRVVNGQLTTVGTDKTPFLFPYLKRVGDWCQALSLLDSSRKYQIYDLARDKLKTTTLGDLRKESETVVALMTVDRILLGYALSLGLDVFFTTGTDLRLVIYYKNKETDIDPAVLATKVAEYSKGYAASIAQLKGDNVLNILQEGMRLVKEEKGDIEYVRRLRAVLYRVSQLRTSYVQLSAKVSELDAEIKRTKDPKLLYRLYFDSATIIRKMVDDVKHNELQKSSFSAYPNLVNDKPTYDAFGTGAARTPSRNAITALQKIISKDMYEDAVQSKKVFDQYQVNIGPMFERPEPLTAELKEAFTAFAGIKLAVDNRVMAKKAKRGGAMEDVSEAILALQSFEVTPLSKKDYDAGLANPAQYEDLPLALMKGSYYYDEGSAPYSVVDKYIVTEAALPVFEYVFPDIASATPEELGFLTLRFLILYSDILMRRYEALVSNEAILPELKEDGTPALGFDGKPVMKENDANYFQHLRLTAEATTLRDNAAALKEDKDFTKAFTSGRNSMNGAERWDWDTIKLYGTDPRTLARNNVFSKAFERIKTARETLLALYEGVEAPATAKRLREEVPEVAAMEEDMPEAEPDGMEEDVPEPDGMEEDAPVEAPVEAPVADGMDVDVPPVEAPEEPDSKRARTAGRTYRRRKSRSKKTRKH